MLTPFGIWWLAQLRGLGAVAITNHNGVFGGKWGSWVSTVLGPPLIVVGQEVTAPDFHMLAVGISKTIPTTLGPREVIAEIHAQGGVAILAHPNERSIARLTRDGARPDGIELKSRRFDSLALALDSIGVPGHSPPFRAGDSDYHWLSSLGYRRSLIFTDSLSARAIVDALARGRVIAVDANGGLHGRDELIDSLPNGARPRDFDYTASGTFDALSRVVGWLGMVGVVTVRRRNA
jgi:hypothetical protein